MIDPFRGNDLPAVPFSMIEEHEPEAAEIAQRRIETGERRLHPAGAGRISIPEGVVLHAHRLPDFFREIVRQRIASDRRTIHPSACVSAPL